MPIASGLEMPRLMPPDTNPSTDRTLSSNSALIGENASFPNAKGETIAFTSALISASTSAAGAETSTSGPSLTCATTPNSMLGAGSISAFTGSNSFICTIGTEFNSISPSSESDDSVISRAGMESSKLGAAATNGTE